MPETIIYEGKMELEEKLSKDFIKGLQTGIQIAKDVAKRQGYEINFPEVSEMKLEEIKKEIKE